VRALGGWLIAREQGRMDKAAAHRDLVVMRAVLTRGWAEGVAVRRRERELTAAADHMAARRRAERALGGWMRHTYYRHMTKVALHWRVRRLGCLTLRHWARAAAMLREDRQQLAELAHHRAAATATNTLCLWQAQARAQRHRRRALMAAAVRGWRVWAAGKAVRSARVREAMGVVETGRLERVFFSWRWYTQVRFGLCGRPLWFS